MTALPGPAVGRHGPVCILATVQYAGLYGLDSQRVCRRVANSRFRFIAKSAFILGQTRPKKAKFYLT